MSLIFRVYLSTMHNKQYKLQLFYGSVAIRSHLCVYDKNLMFMPCGSSAPVVLTSCSFSLRPNILSDFIHINSTFPLGLNWIPTFITGNFNNLDSVIIIVTKKKNPAPAHITHRLNICKGGKELLESLDTFPLASCIKLYWPFSLLLQKVLEASSKFQSPWFKRTPSYRHGFLPKTLELYYWL